MKDKHVDDGGEREKKRAEGLLELGGVYIFRAKHRASPALAATPLVSSAPTPMRDVIDVTFQHWVFL